MGICSACYCLGEYWRLPIIWQEFISGERLMVANFWDYPVVKYHRPICDFDCYKPNPVYCAVGIFFKIFYNDRLNFRRNCRFHVIQVKNIKGVVVKNKLYIFLFICSLQPEPNQQSWIRINQLGYLPHSIKVAVLAGKANITCTKFALFDAQTDHQVWSSNQVKSTGSYGPFTQTYRLDFTEFQNEGQFYLKAGKIKSPDFKINKQVYDGTADFLLKYMRQQRCGFNPFLNDSCHTHDGYTIYGPMPDGTHIDVVGGWHDAADYLQYVTTSANATFNLLFAYRENPESFEDKFDANGLPGANGVPDVLDEAKWGLDWLLKMHPRDDWMFNQIADDRDHRGWRLPTQDTISYGKGLERPVYFCSGEIQGLFNNKNRATGAASTAGKFASAFALGAEIFKDIDSDYTKKLKHKAHSAYQFGKNKPGACQTAPCRAPYFYEEDNWVDDMELGAADLYALTGNDEFLKDAINYSQKEPITPWMGADTARHYQWYPFMNIGHYELARLAPKNVKEKLIDYYRKGIEKVWQRGKDNAFLMGVPFIWCSNNLVTALVTQCQLYRQLSGDDTYLELEAAMRDWLFGCNPWGVSMVIGLPADEVFAQDPHSAFSHLYGYKIDGGLLDGPVYGSIFKSLKYVTLREEDEFASFQSDLVVYHDDMGDYATNEPTMDGTASLIYYLAAMEKEGDIASSKKNDISLFEKNFEYDHGAIIRGDKTKKELALVFTGDQFANGGEHIRKVLSKYQIKASFFFTGNFYRNPAFQQIISTLKSDSHYLGAHSDRHLLYCDWKHRDSLLVSKEQFLSDLKYNYLIMEEFGISKSHAKFYLPPFEWYNRVIANWSHQFGLTLVNYSPGTKSHADWTYPEIGDSYKSSDEILKTILNFEKIQPDGLNGFILLLHIGSDPRRKDKFYLKLEALILELNKRGYRFKRIDELLAKD
jgi:endoglucanase